MIFATVGTQLAFPRLMSALDALAGSVDDEIIAQIGPDSATYPALSPQGALSPQRFEELFSSARLVVAHAGIGTILSARRFGKPLVILPRKAALGEHRNDHQMATAQAVTDLPGIHIAWDEADLPALLGTPDLEPARPVPGKTHGALITRLNQFISEA